MELTHIEHLGIAVKSIEACLPYYEQVLGLKCYSIESIRLLVVVLKVWISHLCIRNQLAVY